MGIDCMDTKWLQLIQSIDNQIRTVAQNANVSYEDLRYRYIIACLYITKPFEYSISNMGIKQTMEFDKTTASIMKYKSVLAGQIAAIDSITTQDQINKKRLKYNQNATNTYNKVHMKQQQKQQHEYFVYNDTYTNSSNYKSVIHQRSHQNFCSRNGSISAYSIPTIISAVNQIPSHKMNVNNINHKNISLSLSKVLLQPKDSNKKKVAKFHCDIEAALAGEISDMEDDNDDQMIIHRNNIIKIPHLFTKLTNDNDSMLHTSASLANRTISLVEEELIKSKQLETRIVRYPNGKPLAINIIHKVYVIELEEAYAWVRLYDGNRPPCFDAVHVILKAMKSLEWEELLPGTPCVVLARFNPLDIVNDGIARELTQFESYARAIIEECHQRTKTVTVRLVDFGFRLTQLHAAAIKPLTIAFDGPPLAIRLQIDLLPKQQKESLCRYVTLCVRLTVSRDKQFLCWSKTWKAIDIKKQNWNKKESEYSLSMKSSDMHNNLNDQNYASSNFGLVTRAVVSSWLNKKHKKAGGPGIEAALYEIAQCHPDLPITEFTLNRRNNLKNKRSLQSTQSSDNCLNQLVSNPIKKIANDWPVVAKLPKIVRNASLKMPKKEENQKQVKKWFAIKKDSEGCNHLEDSTRYVVNNHIITDAELSYQIRE